MTENEYKNFLSDLSLSFDIIKKYYNNVILRDGIPFPYDTDQFYTKVKFYQGMMFFLFET